MDNTNLGLGNKTVKLSLIYSSNLTKREYPVHLMSTIMDV